MTSLSDNILDLDQINDNTVPEDNPSPKAEIVVKEKKKRGRKSNASRNLKGNYNPLLLSPKDGPKLSREERKALQLQELFEKMEQKEKRKEENQRKKRKLNYEKSPNLSVTHDDSNQDEDLERTQENGDMTPSKSDSEKVMVIKKKEPMKVNSKYFNTDYDLGENKNLISYLYDYQKENTEKYLTIPKSKTILESVLFNNDVQPPEGSLISRPESDKLAAINNMLKKKNEKLLEHLKNYEPIQANKDLRHAFYNFDY